MNPYKTCKDTSMKLVKMHFAVADVKNREQKISENRYVFEYRNRN